MHLTHISFTAHSRRFSKEHSLKEKIWGLTAIEHPVPPPRDTKGGATLPEEKKR